MKLYKRRPDLIYVEQFLPDSNIEGITHDQVRVDVDELEDMGLFKIDNITVFVRYGDYVEIKNGKPFKRFHKEEFEQLYELAE